MHICTFAHLQRSQGIASAGGLLHPQPSSGFDGDAGGVVGGVVVVDGGGGCGGGGVLGDGDPAIAMVLLMTQASPLQAEQWLENLFNGDEKLFQRFLDLHSMDGTWTDGYGIMCQVLFTSNSFSK